MRALIRPPRLHVFLFAPMPDAVSDSELSSTASGRVSFHPILHHGDMPKFPLRLSISKDPTLLAYAVAAHDEAQCHLLNLYQVTACKLESNLWAWDIDAEQARSFFPTVIITFDLDPRDIECAYAIYAFESFHIGLAECALCAIRLGGYDGSLEDDTESGFTHHDAPLIQANGRVGKVLATAAALRAVL